MSGVLLVTGDEAFERRLRTALGATLNGDLRRVGSADPAGIAGAEVVALGPGLPLEQALELARRLDADRPEITIVLIADRTPTLWEQALRAGVRDVVTPDAAESELREVFERATRAATRRRENLAGGTEVADPHGGRIITLVSPKGGSGKTMTATNLAVGLAARAPGQVAVVDADLQFGDVTGALQLVPEHTISDVTRGALDAMALKVFLTPHPAELYTLCAPESPAEGEQITGDQVAQVLRLLASEFRYVIVDTAAGLTEHTLSALEISTDMVIVCSMEVSSVRSMRKALDVLEQLGLMAPRRHFVLNRSDAWVGMDAADVEATLGLTVDVAVPSHRTVPLSMNQGVPLLQSDPRSPVARQLRTLAERFYDQPVAPAAAGRRFSWRGGR